MDNNPDRSLSQRERKYENLSRWAFLVLLCACVAPFLPFPFFTSPSDSISTIKLEMSSSVSSSSSVCHLRLLLFGASGRTGQIVLEEALQRGYCVTAFVRNPAKLNGVLAGWSQEKKNRFKLAKGTVVNEVEVEKVIRNGFEDGKPFDAVLSTLTSDEKPHNACSVSTTHVLGAFQKLQDERKSTSDHSSSLSISPFRYLVVGAMFDEEFLNSRSFFESLLLKPALWLFGESAKDRKKEASLLHTAHAANPHWRLLMVAPPLLTNGALTKNYSVDSKNPGMKIWSTVSRSDVAHYMLRLVEEDDAHVKVHTKGIYAPLYDA